jgi:hypothetical protein
MQAVVHSVKQTLLVKYIAAGCVHFFFSTEEHTEQGWAAESLIQLVYELSSDHAERFASDYEIGDYAPKHLM